MRGRRGGIIGTKKPGAVVAATVEREDGTLSHTVGGRHSSVQITILD